MKMNKKDLLIFLGLQVIAVIWAGAVFSLFSSKLVAGAMAGAYFVASGLYMFRVTWRWADKWKTFLLYPLTIHVFVISIPMVMARFSQMQSDFSQIKIWGLEGPAFHQLSTTVFTMLVLATIIDLTRAVRAKAP